MENIVTIENILELAALKPAKFKSSEVHMEVLSLERRSMTPCYDSKWAAEVKNKDGEVKTIHIQRLDIETEDRLRGLIEACNSFDEVKDLWMNIYFD